MNHEHDKMVQRVEDLRGDYCPKEARREKLSEDRLRDEMERARMDPDAMWERSQEGEADGWPGEGDD